MGRRDEIKNEKEKDWKEKELAKKKTQIHLELTRKNELAIIKREEAVTCTLSGKVV